MDSLNRALAAFAAYFGIVAAFLLLSSWLASNYFGERAKSVSDVLVQAEANFRNSRSFRQVYDLINEETQTLDHVYEGVRKFSYQQGSDKGQAGQEAERYNTLVRLDYTRHGDRVVFSELERANQLVDLARLLELPNDSLITEVINARDDMQRVNSARQASKEKLLDVIDSVGNVYKIDDTVWNKVSAAIEEHIKLVEIKLIPEENRISSAIADLELRILDGQRKELSRRRAISTIVKRLAFALYVISAVLALYGKWLEVRYPRPKIETAQTAQATPAGEQAGKSA